MTREQYKQMQMEALESLKTDVAEQRKNPLLLAPMREALDKQYQAICKKQAEWEQGGFWTSERERDYSQEYKDILL